MSTLSKRALRKGEEGFNLFKSLQRLRRRLIRAKRRKPIRKDWQRKRCRKPAGRGKIRSRALHPTNHSIDPKYCKNIFQLRERLGVPQNTPHEKVLELLKQRKEPQPGWL